MLFFIQDSNNCCYRHRKILLTIIAAYDLLTNKEAKSKQSLGKMEKIEVDIMTVGEIKRLLYEGKILNAASIVAFYKALDFHERYIV